MDTKSTAATSIYSDYHPEAGLKSNGDSSPGRSTIGSRSDHNLERPPALFAVNEVGSDSEADLNARLDLAKVNSISTNQVLGALLEDSASEMGGIARTGEVMMRRLIHERVLRHLTQLSRGLLLRGELCTFGIGHLALRRMKQRN